MLSKPHNFLFIFGKVLPLWNFSYFDVCCTKPMSKRYQSKRSPLIRYFGIFKAGLAQNKLEICRRMQLKECRLGEGGVKKIGENADVFYGWSQMKIHCNRHGNILLKKKLRGSRISYFAHKICNIKKPQIHENWPR